MPLLYYKSFFNLINSDFRFSSTLHTSPFFVIGADVDVNMKQIHRAQLDQAIDKAERKVTEDTQQDPLNPKPIIPNSKLI